MSTSRSGTLSRASLKYVLLAAIAICGLHTQSWAAQPYMDDSNHRVPAPDGAPSTQEHLYPRIYAHENMGGLSPQALSKYQFMDVHGISIDSAEGVGAFSPETMVLRHISGREYQGHAQTDPCAISMGVAFADTGPVSQGGPKSAGCDIFAGHWLYKAGSRLTASATSSALTLEVEDAGNFEVGQYVVIYDGPAGSFGGAEHAQVTARNVSAHTLTLKSRGYKSTPKSHAAGSIVAQHVLGQGVQGVTNPLNWAFNFSSKSPGRCEWQDLGRVLCRMALEKLQAVQGRRADDGQRRRHPVRHGFLLRTGLEGLR
jgi:hypothetical protein